ncbi:MAG: hypothetical protein AAB316_25600 [Bacteroidota bacterium]
MKTSPIPCRLVFHFALLIIVSVPALLASQVQITWRGGVPGQEHNWNCPRNWSANRIPGEFDQVRLPDCSSRGSFYPILKTSAESSVQHLRIESGAELTLLPGAELIVDGEMTFASGILLFGSLQNDGRLEVRNSALDPFEVNGGEYLGKGKLVTDEASASVERRK